MLIISANGPKKRIAIGKALVDGKLKKQVKEYDVIKRNIDSILRQPREPEQEKGKERE